jgi:flagellar hook assembly protein FlgD
VLLPFTLPETTPARIVVVDTTGTCRRALIDGVFAAGQHLVLWDQLDDQGVRLPPDIYRCLLEIGEDGANIQALCGGDVRLGSMHPIAAEPAPAITLLALDAYPNPFNPRTVLRFDLPAAGPVALTVHDLRGRCVRRLLQGEVLPGGGHERTWDGRDETGRRLPAGTYLARVSAGGQSASSRLLLLK